MRTKFKNFPIYFLLLFIAHTTKAQDFQNEIVKLVHTPLLEHSVAAVKIYDLSADSNLYAYQANVRLRPASTEKVVTAVTALHLLGTDYSFSTPFYIRGEQQGTVLDGNLYVVGGMDPQLNDKDLHEVATALEARNIDSIRGNIILDRSMKDTLRWGSGWCWDDDNPTLTPLLYKGKDNLGKALLNALKRRGIVVEGDIVYGNVPQNATLIHTCFRPIDEVLQPMLKKSHNLSAEAVFYQLPQGSNRGNQPSSKRAAQVIRRFLNHMGEDARATQIVDGSGLSLYNYQTANILVGVLRFAYRHDSIFNHLYQALPIAGVDGTLHKRMQRGATYANVRAKTGTLNGVYTLVGYVYTADRHLLAFAILNQGASSAAEAHAYQDRICRFLANYSFTHDKDSSTVQ